VSTSGLGCLPGEGLGRGSGFSADSSNLCTATGGAYGGYGGLGISYTKLLDFNNLNIYELQSGYADQNTICSQFKPSAYGKYDSPYIFEGSGGGLTNA
jgi:hypothetical protein